MISVDEAIKIVIENTDVLHSQDIDLKNALGYYLAVDVLSDIDMPPFNKSAMDGYALIADDLSNVPVKLDVIETISAGCEPKLSVKRGQASKIMTGAIVPEGADTVIMVEDTEPIDEGKKVSILKEIKKGKNIALRGEDIQKNQIISKCGKKLRPQEIGALASVGCKKTKVYRAPSVAVIATGDELVELDVELKAGKIRNSNSYSLAAQALQLVKDVEILGIAKDEKEVIASMIKQGLKKDILILSGGVSMGDYDLVGEVLKDCGIDVFFEKVALRPGKPTLFGKKENTLIFALPGNPVATFVTFELFVYPAIRKMMGGQNYNRPIISAILDVDYEAKKKRAEYRPAFIQQGDNGLKVVPVEWHGSADLLSTTNANCLIIVKPESGRLSAGAIVNVMLLGNTF